MLTASNAPSAQGSPVDTSPRAGYATPASQGPPSSPSQRGRVTRWGELGQYYPEASAACLTTDSPAGLGRKTEVTEPDWRSRGGAEAGASRLAGPRQAGAQAGAVSAPFPGPGAPSVLLAKL